MRALLRHVRRFSADRRAATAVEYGFIIALIVLALLATLQLLAGRTTNMWNWVSEQVTTSR
ncbi:Flp family type IVb pilin [Nostoc sp. 3335mG]|nr:Flp family type IVb pilin [Nostoc sp. 3335mG]